MLSIGKFAEIAEVSTRTVRYYESIGLLPTARRGENSYRYYEAQWLEQMKRIRDLQNLGFSLDDIKVLLPFSDQELRERLQMKLEDIEREIGDLQERHERVRKLLSVSNKMKAGEALTATERNLYMETLEQEIMQGLQSRYQNMDASMLAYLERDQWIQKNPHSLDFIEGVRKCLEFARAKNLTLGPLRGSTPASLALFGLGISNVDPVKHNLIPERLNTTRPFFHVDVEYARGQEFVDFCREVNRSLVDGEIQAFKMPLLDIVQNTHRAVGRSIDYALIDDNADEVLKPFRELDLEKIFQFDYSPDALVMAYDIFAPEYRGLSKFNEHFRGQKEFNFRDIVNLTALWRPHAPELIERIELYRQAKHQNFEYDFLSARLKKWLRPNYGVVVYHEDVMQIIAEYSGWDLGRCNLLRRLGMNKKTLTERDQHPDWIEFQKIAPPPVVKLVAEESLWSFCQPHAISFSQFTKQTAVLKSLHREAYFREIENFEQSHGFRWDDIGIRMKGVSLHQG